MKLRIALFAAFLFLLTRPAFSQGCAMCYSTAAASTKQGQQAVSKGVMVLLFPPMGFMTLGVWMAFRYGRKRDLEQAPHLTSLRVYDSADADRRSNEALFESNFGA